MADAFVGAFQKHIKLGRRYEISKRSQSQRFWQLIVGTFDLPSRGVIRLLT